MTGALVSLIRKELSSHFAHSMALIFIFSYAALSYYWLFYPGDFFARNLADYGVILEFQPYLLLFLLPALTMNLWSAERHGATTEVLFTLPLSSLHIVLGKFIAVFLIALLAIAQTLPFWLLLNYLGTPDNSVIALGYLGLMLVTALYIAIGHFFALLSRSPLGGFLLTLLTLVALVFIGEPFVYGVVKPYLSANSLDILQSMSLLNHYQPFTLGYFAPADLLYFLISISVWLWLGYLLLNLQKAR